MERWDRASWDGEVGEWLTSWNTPLPHMGYHGDGDFDADAGQTVHMSRDQFEKWAIRMPPFSDTQVSRNDTYRPGTMVSYGINDP